MEPETLSGLQELGGTGVLAIAVWHFAKLSTAITNFLNAQQAHQQRTEAHQARLETLLVVHPVPNPAPAAPAARVVPVREDRQIAIELG